MAVFVLVHGAGAGGWLWRRLCAPLAAAGHELFTPTLTGLGERQHLARRDTGLGTHVDDVVGVIEAEELADVVLVGFDYAGALIATVADRLPGRVRRLVYLDAIVPGDGESVLDVMPPEVRDVWQRSVLAGDGWRVPPLPWPRFGAADDDGASEAELHRLLARRVPHPLACFTEPVTIRAPDALPPSSYIRCTDKLKSDLAARLPERARTFDLYELPTGHFCMLTMPGRTAALLAQIAAR